MNNLFTFENEYFEFSPEYEEELEDEEFEDEWEGEEEFEDESEWKDEGEFVDEDEFEDEEEFVDEGEFEDEARRRYRGGGNRSGSGMSRAYGRSANFNRRSSSRPRFGSNQSQRRKKYTRQKYPRPDYSRASAGGFSFPYYNTFNQMQPDCGGYVRLVQRLLNRALGLNLPVDGMMSVETRSAIRSFLSRKGSLAGGLSSQPSEPASPDSGANQPDEPPGQTGGDNSQEEYDELEFSDWQARAFSESSTR